MPNLFSLIFPLVWMGIVAFFWIRRFVAGTDDFLRPVFPLFDDTSEFPFPYEIVRTAVLGQDFTYKYLSALIDVRALQVGRRKAIAFRINRPFPENLIIKKNYALLAELARVFPVRPWRRRGKRSKLDLVVTNKDVGRQLARIPEFQLILANTDCMVAARYTDRPNCSAEEIAGWGSALYDLHLYASRVLRAPDLPVETIPVAACCPYCREPLGGDNSRICGRCGTMHHAPCWEENGGCAVFGCSGHQSRDGILNA